MKSWIWLRALAGVLGFFALGHTVGVLKPPAAGSPAAAVLAAMWSVRFPANGFVRSYGEFYRGFGLFVTLEFAVLAVFAYQLSVVGRREPTVALLMAVTLQAACIASAVLSWRYFFAAPMAMSLVAVACATMAVALLVREAKASH